MGGPTPATRLGEGKWKVLGYYVQGLVTRQGPVENWASHIADPNSANVFAYTSDLTMFASAGDKLAV